MKNTNLDKVEQAQVKVRNSEKKAFSPTNFPMFIRVEKKDATLKFVFDNIRNIGIAALLAVIGYSVGRGCPPKIAGYEIAGLEVAAGVFLVVLALVLVLLNFVQSILAYLSIFGRSLDKIPYYALYLIIFFIIYCGVVTIFTAQVYNFSKS